VTGTVGIIGSSDRTLEDLLRTVGMRPLVMQADMLASTARTPVTIPDAVLVDVRQDRSLLASIASIKRRYPAMGVAIVAATLDSDLMLEAMRAGVTEAITEPITQLGLESSISRVISQYTAPVEGRVFALVGAKGGIGATTVAVNLAEALARATGNALLIDLQAAAGDSAVLLGVEPRFTVAEALENTHRLDEAFFKGLVVRTRSGLDLLAPSTRVINAPVDPHKIRALIDFATRFYGSVVLDVPRGDLSLIDSLEAASSIFVVVNHELPTIRAAHRLMLKLRQRYGDRVGLLVNRSDREAEISLEDIEKAVNAPIKHVFPSDYRTALAAVNKGQPLAQSRESKLAQSFHEFAANLTGASGKAKEKAPEESGGLFGWLSGRRSA
jgi:pilus assembly protein CpaE